VNFRATSGPVIAKSGDLAALLTNLEAGDVLFIDEIHRLNPVVEEVLYPAMEDRALDLMIGEGPSARSVRIDLPPFTLIGATTRQGLLQTRCAIASAFRCACNSTPWPNWSAWSRAAPPDGRGHRQRARARSPSARGTPRVAGRLLRRVRDFAQVMGDGTITRALADQALTRLEVDRWGWTCRTAAT
jgi:Holliday junction DNA helicase RuvB